MFANETNTQKLAAIVRWGRGLSKEKVKEAETRLKELIREKYKRKYLKRDREIMKLLDFVGSLC